MYLSKYPGGSVQYKQKIRLVVIVIQWNITGDSCYNQFLGNPQKICSAKNKLLYWIQKNKTKQEFRMGGGGGGGALALF